jgi:hypothetical protein
MKNEESKSLVRIVSSIGWLADIDLKAEIALYHKYQSKMNEYEFLDHCLSIIDTKNTHLLYFYCVMVGYSDFEMESDEEDYYNTLANLLGLDDVVKDAIDTIARQKMIAETTGVL